jgi:Queuine tRNA-ribosyltransferase
MLHAIDGCVPYLTPSLLESHFPATDDLWIGLAVRDTCVVPLYDNGKGAAKEKTRPKSKGGIRGGKNKNTKENLTNEAAPKPRGYTFAAVEPDPWLSGYTRVTVPSFDLLNDSGVGKQQPQGPGSGNHMLVWTPHGRQTLTLELYAEASAGLQSHHTLSLYDMSQDGSRKRQEKVLQHTQGLFQEFMERRKTSNPPAGPAWAPILIPPKDAEQSKLSLEHIQVRIGDISGVALIGSWRLELEEQLKSVIGGVPTVALLATDSLSEFLEACTSRLINVIGTELPTRWAKEKRALTVNCRPCATLDENTTTKRTKFSHDDTDQQHSSEALDSNGLMDLHDSCWARDSRPIVPGCKCMTCNNDNFSRGYIHHLVCAKEMVAEILLFGHNLYHLLELARCFSEADNPAKLRELIQAQLG